MSENESFNQHPSQQQSKTPFYKNLWFWVAVVVILILIGKEASGLLVKGKPVQPSQVSQPVTTQEVQAAPVPSAPAQIATSTTAPVTTQAGQPAASSSATEQDATAQRNSVIQKAFATGQAVEAQQGQQYPFEKLVLFNNEDVGLCIDQFGCKLEYTGNSTVYYYVDFGFFNGTNQPYNWDSSQFKLVDSSGFSYSPNIILARGDSNGTISPQTGGRGEVVFVIPAFQNEIAQTTLVFNTNEDPSQLEYSLNLQDFNNYYWQEQQKQQSQSSQGSGQQ